MLQRVHILTFQSLWLKQHLAVQGSKYTFFYVAAVGTAAVEVFILDEYHLYMYWKCMHVILLLLILRFQK